MEFQQNNQMDLNLDKKSKKRKGASSEESIVAFKKVMMGFNPTEVYEYIEAINSNLAKAQKVFEEKSEEYKSSNALLSRERDSLKERFAQSNETIAELEAKNQELLAIIDELKNVHDQNNQLNEQNQILQAKLDSCQDLITENQNLKNQIQDNEMERQLAEQLKIKLSTEIAELREINKKQAYDFAQQKNEIETAYSNERLRILQLLQVHAYHIEQSEDLLKEFLSQFAQARDSFKEINIK